MKLLEEVKELYSKGEYELAISLIDKTENSNQNPTILVWKSRCLQLLNNNVPDDVLEQVEECLIQALDLDNENQEALIELGYFYLRVLDDAARAKPFFENSLSLITSNATESIIGIAECISDLESDFSALEYLNKNSVLSVRVSEIEEVIDRLQSQSIPN